LVAAAHAWVVHGRDGSGGFERSDSRWQAQSPLEASDATGRKVALDHIDEAVICSNELEIWGEGHYPFLMNRQHGQEIRSPY